MPFGNLDEHLFVRKKSKASLTMARRSRIIGDVAHGLQHLHRHRVVHGSIKASNILLDKDFTARVGDFGHFLEDQPPSKDHPAGGGGSSSSARDALVYMAPECSPNSPFAGATCEIDVFYFGAVVLEVVTGRHTCGGGGGGGDIPEDGFVFLVDWVWELHRRGCILDAVLDATILQGRSAGGQLNRDVAKKLLLVGLACSHPVPSQRPSMKEVVEMLQTEGVPPPEVPPEKPVYDHAHAQQAESSMTVQHND